MLAFGMNEYCMIFVTVIDSSKNKNVYYKKTTVGQKSPCASISLVCHLMTN